MGTLPSLTYSYFRFEPYCYILILLVEDYSHYGYYSCEGIIYDRGAAYYDIAALKPCKLRVETICSFYNTAKKL